MTLEATHLSQLNYVWVSKPSMDVSIVLNSLHVLQAKSPSGQQPSMGRNLQQV